jgi:hypothetical protein
MITFGRIFGIVCISFVITYLAGCFSHPIQVCPRQTFLQIYKTTSADAGVDFDRLFQKTLAFGFDTVFLQWSSYDDVSFYRDPRAGKTNDLQLTSIIQAACKADVNLWLGLHHDSQFWDRGAKPHPAVKSYLKQRVLDLRQRIPMLQSAIADAAPHNGCIQGWYISDEVDDMTWEDIPRQKLLVDALQSMRYLLKQTWPQWPVAISGFTNRIKTPQAYARFWDSLLTKADINLLMFQDGIGAAKLTLETEEQYIQALTTMAQKKHYDLSVVVELFDLETQRDGTNHFSSAGAARVTKQLNIAEKAGAEQFAVFAATPYLLQDDMSGRKALATFWKKSVLQSCK